MKRVFLAISLAAVLGAAGQQKEVADLSSLIKRRIDASKERPLSLDLIRIHDRLYSDAPLKDLNGRFACPLQSGDLVYALPADNMPCVVPDHTQHYFMPVIRKGMQTGETGRIPNLVQ